MIYERCILKTLLAGGERAKALRAKLKTKLTTKASVQKTKTTGGSESEDQGQVPANAPESVAKVTENPVLANIYSVLGFVDEDEE